MSDNEIAIVCDACATALANDDWSHLDFYGPDDEQEATIAAFIERGWWTNAGPVREDDHEDAHGYFPCACCGDDAVGPGQWLELS